MCKCPCDDPVEEELVLDRTCDVVGERCEAPPALTYLSHEKPPKVYECHACGLDVCGVCSSMRNRGKRYGVQRMCDRCQEEEDGTPYLIVKRHALRSGMSQAEALAAARHYDTPKQAQAKILARRLAAQAAYGTRMKKLDQPRRLP